MIKQNMESAKTLFIAIETYYQLDYGRTNQLPTTLNELVSAGILKEIPKCKCSDGVSRDFIYLSGNTEILPDDVIIASPPEMDSKVTIIWYGGGPKLLSHDEATKEIDRSLSEIKWLQEAAVPKEKANSMRQP